MSEVSSSILNQSISILDPTVQSSPARIIKDGRSPSKNLLGKSKNRVQNTHEKDFLIYHCEEDKPNLGHRILGKGGSLYVSNRGTS